MKTLVAVLSTLVTLGGIGIAAGETPPATQATNPTQLTPEQISALRDTFSNLPAGSKVRVEVKHRDEGSATNGEQSTGKGASATSEGDKLNDQITGEAPVLARGADGSASAKGGGIDRETSASAVKVPASAWANPLLWAGILAIAGAGVAVYFGLRRAAVISGIAGAGLILSAAYPGLMLLMLLGVVVAVLGPYLYAEWQKRKGDMNQRSAYEALRAVVAGVEGPGVPAEARAAVKAVIAKESDAADRAVIDQVKREDKIGKYAD